MLMAAMALFSPGENHPKAKELTLGPFNLSLTILLPSPRCGSIPFSVPVPREAPHLCPCHLDLPLSYRRQAWSHPEKRD